MDTFSLFRTWRQDAATRLSENTVRTYRGLVFRFWADHPHDPLTVTPATLRADLNTLLPRHARMARAGLNDFFSFLVRRGLRADNPITEARLRRAPRERVKRGLSDVELAALLDAADQVDPTGTLRWLMTAQYGLCLRPGELVKLTAADLSLHGPGSCVYVTETKTGRDRAVPLVGIAHVAVEKLLASGSGFRLAPYGRTQYWSRVRQAATLAGLAAEKCRPYALRHTGATHMLERGVSVRVVQEVLGHSDLRHTMVYTQPSAGDVRRGLELLG